MGRSVSPLLPIYEPIKQNKDRVFPTTFSTEFIIKSNSVRAGVVGKCSFGLGIAALGNKAPRRSALPLSCQGAAEACVRSKMCSYCRQGPMDWDGESICSRCEIADGALGQSDLELLDVDRAKEPLNKD